jgi:hypothetical protein
MRTERNGWETVLFLIVIAHLALSFAHGAAHQGAGVGLSPAGNLYVLAVIVIGPVAGAVWRRISRSPGSAWLIAATMTGSLMFGVVNHFVIESPDHVAHVTGPWHTWFAVTAALLALTEGIGLTVSGRLAAGYAGRLS